MSLFDHEGDEATFMAQFITMVTALDRMAQALVKVQDQLEQLVKEVKGIRSVGLRVKELG